VSLKYELQSIISGNGEVRHGGIIQAVAAHLAREKDAIFETQGKECSRKEVIIEVLLQFRQTI
jgi:hypothetical protein